jgi:AAA domain
MSSGPAIRQILGALAALAPDRQESKRLHISNRDMVPLPLRYTTVVSGHRSIRYEGDSGRLTIGPPRQLVEPLVKRAQLHREENLLRLGWLWVRMAGENGNLIQFPLVSVPVRSSQMFGALNTVVNAGAPHQRTTSLTVDGDLELTDAIGDAPTRRFLEASVEFGGGALDSEAAVSISDTWLNRLPKLQRWAMDAAAAAGLARVEVRATAPEGSESIGKIPQVLIQLALYITEATTHSITIASTLRSWPDAGLDDTALAALYRPTDVAPAAVEPVESPLVLTSAQRAAVDEARHQHVTVVSGAPGNGKTQTIAAIALDAIERRQSVLVAAPTSAAVDALVDLLGRTPGPEPMVFGSNVRRLAVADQLANGGGPPLASDVTQQARDAHDAARRDHRALLANVHQLLDAEQLAGNADPALLFHQRRVAPRWFEPSAALDDAAVILDACRQRPRVFADVRIGRRVRKLRAHANAAATADIDQLTMALRIAQGSRASAELGASGGLDLEVLWPQVVASDAATRAAAAVWLDAELRSGERRGRGARSTMVLVAAALRSSRAVRREKLAAIDGLELTRALPLWVGTLRDIDDLLPQTAGMFDLVIIDEATQVDQVMAAPALLRGRRCVVAGDTRQLRHVSFTSDDAIGHALEVNGIVDPVDIGRLDVRRMGLFDLAAGVAPVRVLDQHFRSAPHLISFSARRFYDGHVTVSTTHPRNDRRDCITVEVLDASNDDGVKRGEIDRALAMIRERQAAARAAKTATSVGVLSPFRAQADAIEAAIVKELSLEEIDELDLRVGTVHGFQGCERDIVIISLGLDPSSSSKARSFVADPNLFNVMVTRAREDIVVLTSLPLDSPGLIGEYLRHGDAPPSAPRSQRASRPDVSSIAVDLSRREVATALEYPSGPHVIDLVIGEGERALGVLFGVHPDGPEAHVERHLQLRRAGWKLREVFDTRWADRRGELALELGHEYFISQD